MRRLAASAVFASLLAGGECRAEEEKASPSPALSLLRQIDEGFVQVFERVAPAVVVVEANKRVSDNEARDEFKAFEGLLRDGEDPDSGDEKGKERGSSRFWPLPQQSRSEGSGFLIRADGYILTNHHVVADADKVEVRLRDGRVFKATLAGADDATDIAVLKIDATQLPVANLGDSDALRVGQLVCAIGAPYNQDYSFTCGWVSGKGRTNLLGPSSRTILYEDYIQTDAFINPGNSGGPLFDVEGRVIGMNTLINGIGRGLAFAIPSNMLSDISAQLIATGKVQRAWLGIRIETLSERSPLREHLAGVEKGVIVNTIEANAPAYRSDLRPADVITEVDGVKLSSARDLQKEVVKKKVGQTVQLTVWRSGKTLKVLVPTGELPSEITRVANLPGKKLERNDAEVLKNSLGLELKDASPKGAAVAAIAENGLAAQSELERDDVITSIDGEAIENAASAYAALTAPIDENRKRARVLNIDRKGRRTFAVLEIPN